MFKDFKEFLAKGNVLDLAVGLIMATYFGAIVKSLVNDIIMPPIGKAMGGVDFNDMKHVIQEAKPAVMEGDKEISAAMEEISINYGAFINNIITFVIVAFCIFMVVRAYNKMKSRMEKKKEEAPAAPPAPTVDQELLTEIRDLLKK
ncbi:MAG: large conductance mechanosensitive channel protein MscL [Fluviicola sp. XM-24bin1]|nr:MAG: large conductance mechanosensitive channel protein MscL [Fluviicola sp. XM-24bin1]